MIIYKITNLINGKWYIGQDSKNNPKYYGSGVFLKKAIKKYGKKNFTKDILEFCDNLDSLNKAEIKWIKNYNAVKSEKSYNLAEGGKKGPVMFGSDNYNYGKYPSHMVEKTRREVVCVNDGKKFKKITDASNFYNIPTNKISGICKLRLISYKGFVFRYIGEEHLVRKKRKGGFKKGNVPQNRKKVVQLCSEGKDLVQIYKLAVKISAGSSVITQPG